jgi:hypothetical protein
MLYDRLQHGHRRCLRIAMVAVVFFLIGTGGSQADPCADQLVNFEPGDDGGWIDSRVQLPDVVLGLPRGGSEFSQSLDVLSLGSGGSLTLGFLDNAIVDRPGNDFLVFENAFRNSPTLVFREAAFVEASEDGLVFYRFPVVYADGTVATPADLQASPSFDSTDLLGVAGLTPTLSHPDNGVDPRTPEAGGDGFDLAAIGLTEARYIRIIDAGTEINDEGNNFPIVGQGKAGADIDAVVAIHSRETCGTCCDAVFDGELRAQDLLVLQRAARDLPTENICGSAPCTETQCGDMNDDGDLGTEDVWLCVDRALGGDVPCPAGNCDLPAAPPQTTAGATNTATALEIPAPGSIQSGIGIVSGWKCTGGRLTASFDGGDLLEVAYGTPRGDTLGVCGDQDNAFVMLWNYSNLPDGDHTLQLFDDGVEFATSTFRTQTLGRKFLGATHTTGQLEFSLANFPEPSENSGVRIGWQTASQSFDIIGLRNPAEESDEGIANLARTNDLGTDPPIPGSLEIPASDSTVSGVSLVSGWRCDAGEITATFDQGDPIPVAYGTSRRDTLSICGDENNAYALQWNFGLLGDGPHTLELRDNGEIFATRNFYVSGLGTPFYRGAQGSYALSDFPTLGDTIVVEWSEANQSFQTVAYQPGNRADPDPSPTPQPTATPMPTPTPASISCDGTLEVEVYLEATDPAGVLLRLAYPPGVTLPEPTGALTTFSRVRPDLDPLPQISAFFNQGDHLGIALVDTDGIPDERLATILFDCNGLRPAPGDFNCEADVSDRLGNAIAADCILALN